MGVRMKPLSPLSALWAAFLDDESKVYPSENGVRISPKDIAVRVRESLRSVREPLATKQLEKARESLEEAKGQTEYQDQKISRLLTIISFLTAAAAALFSKVIDIYPLDLGALCTAKGALVAGTYLSFFIFILFVISGALVSFHGMRTRFVWESSRGELSVVAGKSPASHLFFQESVCTSPDKWGESFAAAAEDQIVEAYKGYVVEAYLVNAKIAEKLRLLEPAQAILSGGIRILLIWLLLTAALFTVVARPSKEDQRAVPVAKETPLQARSQGGSSPADSPSAAQAAVVGQSIVVNCNAARSQGKPPARTSAPTHSGKCGGSVP